MASLHYEVAILTRHTRATLHENSSGKLPPNTSAPCSGQWQDQSSSVMPNLSEHFGTSSNPEFLIPHQGDLQNRFHSQTTQLKSQAPSNSPFSSYEVANSVSDFQSSADFFSSESSSIYDLVPSWALENSHAPPVTDPFSNRDFINSNALNFSNGIPFGKCTDDAPGTLSFQEYAPRENLDVHGSVESLSDDVFEANLERVAANIFEIEFLTDPTIDAFRQVPPGIEDEGDSSTSYRSARSSLSVNPEDVGIQGTESWLWSHNNNQRDQSEICSRSDVSEAFSTAGVYEAPSIAESEDNFGDVESSDKSVDVVKAARFFKKRPIRFETKLETIFSPPTKTEAPTTHIDDKPEIQPITSSSSGAGSSCSGSEVDKTSGDGFRDSGADTADSVETSSLNPNCQPFVPRALRPHTFNDDSGFPNVTNIVNTSNLGDTIGPSCFKNEATVEYIKPSISRIRCIVPRQKPIAPSFEQFPSPYLCPVNHRQDFVPVQIFTLNDLPRECRTQYVFDTVMAVSHRVVQLEVKREILHLEPTLFGTGNGPSMDPNDVTEHLGTGFVQFIDKDRIEIRTHSAVLSNADDALSTKVKFSIFLPHKRVPIEVTCFGEKRDFRCNQYSQSSTFSCKTPWSLLPYLTHFKDYPAVMQSSYFNDSCYFTDSSPDTSVNHDGELSDSLKGHLQSHLCSSNDTEDSTSISDNFFSSYSTNPYITDLHYGNVLDMESTSTNSQCDHFNDNKPCELPLWATETIPEDMDFEIPDDVLPPLFENNFDFLGVNEENVYQAFMSVENEIQTVSNTSSEDKEEQSEISLSEWEEKLSVLEIVERRMKKTGETQAEEPFGTIGLYTNFSSFAGDVLAECSPWSSSQQTCDLSVRQEFEGLLYAQNNNRDEYNRLYKSSAIWDLPSAADTDSEETEQTSDGSAPDDLNNADVCETTCALEHHQHHQNKSAFSAVDTEKDFADYFDSWDRDLLNMDENLDPLPPYQALEHLVNDILDDDDEEEEEPSENIPTQKTVLGAYSLIISHPHGGPKSISIGQFSGSHHVGGDLYDAPTCMGSCGAPVLALNPTQGTVHVTSLVHAGSALLKHVPVGLGTHSYVGDGTWSQASLLNPTFKVPSSKST